MPPSHPASLSAPHWHNRRSTMLSRLENGLKGAMLFALRRRHAAIEANSILRQEELQGLEKPPTTTGRGSMPPDLTLGTALAQPS